MSPVGWPVFVALTIDPPHPEAGTKEPIGSQCPRVGGRMLLVTAFASSWKRDLASCILHESHQVMGRASMAAVASILVFVELNYLSSVI